MWIANTLVVQKRIRFVSEKLIRCQFAHYQWNPILCKFFALSDSVRHYKIEVGISEKLDLHFLTVKPVLNSFGKSNGLAVNNEIRGKQQRRHS